MSDNQKDKATLSMKVLNGPKQIEREMTETIWDRFERLQRSLAPLRKGKQIKRGVYRIKREDESISMAFKKKDYNWKRTNKTLGRKTSYIK